MIKDVTKNTEQDKHIFTVFMIFLKLGLTSFGGPIAHLGYFHQEFVVKRRWLSEQNYADLVALCQFLPGPASSQVGLALGKMRAGYMGALVAWVGFTLPSALILILFGLGLTYSQQFFAQGAVFDGVLHGLKIVALAVVIQAVWGMAKSFCVGTAKITLMAIAAMIVLLSTGLWTQLSVIVAAGLIGLIFFKNQKTANQPLSATKVDSTLNVSATGISYSSGSVWLVAFFALLVGLPILQMLYPSEWLSLADVFYRAGALVFGGGHVVLPLLQTELVASGGYLSQEVFLAGYGATQAVPGPLFTFAAFLGASLTGSVNGWVGGLLCTIMIFLPSYLLIMGVLPFWENLRRNNHAQAALAGVNAAVVGLLLAAIYQPMWINTIAQPQDFAFTLAALVVLMFWKVAPWLVVIIGAMLGGLFSLI